MALFIQTDEQVCEVREEERVDLGETEEDPSHAAHARLLPTHLPQSHTRGRNSTLTKSRRLNLVSI